MARFKNVAALAGAAILATGIAPVASLAASAQTAPGVSATPSSAAPGATVTITGTLACADVEPGGTILLSLEFTSDDDILHTRFPDDAVLQADDSFEVTTAVPTSMASRIDHSTQPTPAGAHTIIASCSASQGTPETAYGSLTVTTQTPPTSSSTTTTTTTSAGPTTTAPRGPVGSFTPPAAPPASAVGFEAPPSGPVAAGGEVTIDEDGFVAGETVHAVLYSTPLVLASLTADATGAVRGTVSVPSDVEPGEHTLVLYGSDLVRAAPLTVTAAAAPGGQPGGTASADELPRTGSGTALLAGLGGALLLAGAAMIRARRGLPAGRP